MGTKAPITESLLLPILWGWQRVEVYHEAETPHRDLGRTGDSENQWGVLGLVQEDNVGSKGTQRETIRGGLVGT